jgi:hypothetical protein
LLSFLLQPINNVMRIIIKALFFINVRCIQKCFTTSLYMKSRAWRSVRLEAAKPTNNLLSSKLTEPRANQQGKLVQIYQKPR